MFRFRSFRARIALLLLCIVFSFYLFIYLLHLIENDVTIDEYIGASEDLPKTVGKYPILLWWTPFIGKHGRHKRCGKSVCYFTDGRDFLTHKLTRGLLFYGSDFKATDLPLPRLAHHDWALLHEESPKNNYLFSTKKVMELFNHTSTFRSTSDLPLTFQYLDHLDSLTSHKYFVPTREKNEKLSTLSPFVYVHSHCDAPSDRDSYVRELMKYIKVDSYGKCLHNKDLPSNISSPINGMNAEFFLKILANYKFTLAFENGICDDYITEKLWRALTVGSVPIYYGAPNIKDWLPDSKSAILIQDFESPQELAKYLLRLNENDMEYESHLRVKLQQEITNRRLIEAMEQRKWGINNDLEKGSFIDHFECMVCERISKNFINERDGKLTVQYRATIDHYGCPEPVSPLTKKPDPQSWWLDMHRKAQHEAKALENLLSSGKNFSAHDFFSEVILILESEAR